MNGGNCFVLVARIVSRRFGEELRRVRPVNSPREAKRIGRGCRVKNERIVHEGLLYFRSSASGAIDEVPEANSNFRYGLREIISNQFQVIVEGMVSRFFHASDVCQERLAFVSGPARVAMEDYVCVGKRDEGHYVHRLFRTVFLGKAVFFHVRARVVHEYEACHRVDTYCDLDLPNSMTGRRTFFRHGLVDFRPSVRSNEFSSSTFLFMSSGLGRRHLPFLHLGDVLSVCVYRHAFNDAFRRCEAASGQDPIHGVHRHAHRDRHLHIRRAWEGGYRRRCRRRYSRLVYFRGFVILGYCCWFTFSVRVRVSREFRGPVRIFFVFLPAITVFDPGPCL